MERTFWQKLEGTTETILNQLKKLIDEGNIRRIVVKQRGRTVAEFPLTAGVIGAVIAPVAAAIGALSALLAECSIEVEKIEVERPDTEKPVDTTAPEPQATAVNQ
jgi:DNA-binding Lrp family transcriptional regulator